MDIAVIAATLKFQLMGRCTNAVILSEVSRRDCISSRLPSIGMPRHAVEGSLFDSAATYNLFPLVSGESK